MFSCPSTVYFRPIILAASRHVAAGNLQNFNKDKLFRTGRDFEKTSSSLEETHANELFNF